MKKIWLLFSVPVLFLFLSAAVFLDRHASGGTTSFMYKVTSTAIIITVSYDRDQSPQVEKYIDSCLQPEIVFGDKHKANKEVLVSSSQLQYHVKGSPGELKITADKQRNAVTSLDKLKNIFEGLKSVIKS